MAPGGTGNWSWELGIRQRNSRGKLRPESPAPSLPAPQTTGITNPGIIPAGKTLRAHGSRHSQHSQSHPKSTGIQIPLGMVTPPLSRWELFPNIQKKNLPAQPEAVPSSHPSSPGRSFPKFPETTLGTRPRPEWTPNSRKSHPIPGFFPAGRSAGPGSLIRERSRRENQALIKIFEEFISAGRSRRIRGFREASE